MWSNSFWAEAPSREDVWGAWRQTVHIRTSELDADDVKVHLPADLFRFILSNKLQVRLG